MTVMATTVQETYLNLTPNQVMCLQFLKSLSRKETCMHAAHAQQGLGTEFYNLLLTSSLFPFLKHSFTKTKAFARLVTVLPLSFAMVSNSHSLISCLIMRQLLLLEVVEQSKNTASPSVVPCPSEFLTFLFCMVTISV